MVGVVQRAMSANGGQSRVAVDDLTEWKMSIYIKDKMVSGLCVKGRLASVTRAHAAESIIKAHRKRVLSLQKALWLLIWISLWPINNSFARNHLTGSSRMILAVHLP